MLGIVTAVLALLVLFLGWEVFRNRKETKEYKELLGIADAEYKKAQEDLRALLEKINNQNVIMERASQALDVARGKVSEQDTLIKALDEKLRFQESQYVKLTGQKKSSEVRTGKIAEQIAPFLNDYPMNPNTARFIGDPIDFVHFDEEGITFVEVKSGKSQLSKKQRRIRDQISQGKVDFKLYRIKGDDDGPNKS